MQVFDRKREKSLQRTQQRMIDQPMIVHYSKDFTIHEPKEPVEESLVQEGQELAAEANENLSTFKSLIYPLSTKSVLLRLSNLEDSFDEKAKTIEIDLNKFASQLYLKANPNGNAKIEIEEMTLSGVTDFLKKTTTQWHTNEPQSLVQGLKQAPKDKSPRLIKLEPQRIRAFKVVFN